MEKKNNVQLIPRLHLNYLRKLIDELVVIERKLRWVRFLVLNHAQ